VNHAFAYNDLFDANVRGTAEVIRFAMHKRFKTVCYMSSVGMIEGLKRDGMVYESEDAEGLWQDRPVTGRYGTGYSTTKWACEVLLRDANRKWGLPANVFRCPLLLPHSQYAGQTNTTDLFIRLLLTMLHTGYAPPNIFEDPTATGFGAFPVDFAAKCLAELTTGGTTGFNNYNIAAPDDGKQGSFVVFVADRLRADGYNVQMVPDYNEWIQRASKGLEALAENPGAKMGAPVMLLMKNPMPTPPIYDVTRFSEKMAAANLWAQMPPFNDAYIRKCLEDLIGLNLLHRVGPPPLTLPVPPPLPQVRP